MVVLVTGGSGFVGSHLIARLTSAGHRVRALARDRGRLARALGPHHATHHAMRVEVVEGDVRDPAAVKAAMPGCDAVIHAANVYSLDVRRRAEMHHTNIEGTRIVLAAALEAGCDPVVHVSSMVALLPAQEPITDAAPIGTNETTAYVGSKVRAERIARGLQDEGAPVVTTYPGAVFGPLDPAAGEMLTILGGALESGYLTRLTGDPGFSIVDVRWVADAHERLLVSGQGPRQVTMGGRYVSMDDYVGLLRSLTGRRLPALIPSPKGMTFATGRVADALRRSIRLRLPFSYEQAWLVYAWPPSDDRMAQQLIGPPPPLEETVGDAIRWMLQAGHLSPKRAGALQRQSGSASRKVANIESEPRVRMQRHHDSRPRSTAPGQGA